MKNEKTITILETAGKTIYRQGDTLIKRFDAKYSKADILNEALNHARVEETCLNIPRIKGIEVVDGQWAILLDYIDGQTLQDAMDADPDSLDAYLEMFTDLQIQVLSRSVPLLNKYKDKTQARISAAKLDATTRYELHTRLDSMPRHAALLHGDFNPTNIILTKNGPYIIDWAHATQGNASADVANTYLLFHLAGRGDIAEKYLRLYCRKSDTAIQYVQRWIPIVAAARLSKAIPEEDALLRRWTDVVDYE
ncbi:MAG: aminoglycoside phosphotransferase family protein [Clostridia bacterium]|nr:aminoglycoside phosphotransferase family protein [Clostridia bacterium]